MLSETSLTALGELFKEVESSYDHKTKKYTMEQILDNAKSIKDVVKQIDSGCGVEQSGSSMRTAVLHEYLNNISKKCVDLENLARELDDKFLLFVMGSGKNGKSTLINALLGTGEEIAKTNFLPKTWKIDIYSTSQEKKHEARLIFADGNVKEMAVTEANKFLDSEESKQDKSQIEINKKVRQYKSDGASIEQLEQLKAKLRKYDLYISPVTEVVWPVSGSEVLKDYRIVDTPGLKQELASDMIISSAKDYYGKADGIIWLLPGDKVAGKTDYDELMKLRKDYGASTDNIVAVINKFDKAEATGQGEQVLADAKRLYGGIFKTFIPVSAKNAFEALQVLNKNRLYDTEKKEALAKYEKSGIPNLLRHLKQTFYANALDIQMSSKYRAIEVLYADVRTMLMELNLKLNEANNRYKILENEWQNESDSALSSLDNALRRFKDRECERIYDAVSRVEDELWEMDGDDRNTYIKNNLIRPSYVESNLKRVISDGASKLASLQSEYVKKSAFKEFPNLTYSDLVKYDAGSNMLDNSNLGDITNDGGAQLMLGGALALGAAALLGPVGLLFVGFAATDAGRSIAKFLSRTFGKSIAQKTTDRFSSQMDNVLLKINEQYKDMSKQASENVRNVRDTTFSALYGSYYEQDKIKDLMDNIDSFTKKQIEYLTLEDILFK